MDSVTSIAIYYLQEVWKFPKARSILNLIDSATAAEYQGIMKAPQQHHKPIDREAKEMVNGLGAW